MSTRQHEINNDPKVLIAYDVKCETNDGGDDDFMIDNSSILHEKKNYYSSALSTSAILNPSLTAAYKGKIEVTSKGRRKIFDGVRWQILCRRPDCRKQTNKKSLCITHYKEEYESSHQQSPVPWSSNYSQFQLHSYPSQHSFESTTNHIENEDQNNTISTTNTNDSDEQSYFMLNNEQSPYEGQIECMSNGQRFILKNSKWLPLCKYDRVCRNIAKYEFLCQKHFDLRQSEKRHLLRLQNYNDNRRARLEILDDHHKPNSNNIAKRLKLHNDYQISSSSVTEQFIINNYHNNYTAAESSDDNLASSSSSMPSDHVAHESNATTYNSQPNACFILSRPKSAKTSDQSVQTDLVIPLCCTIHHQEGCHSFYSSCRNNNSVSSEFLKTTKSEP